MKKESFQIREIFSVKPAILYHAWLDSDKHSQMTGGEADCSDHAEKEFTAWDGYITGKNIKLIENKEIVQSWRTTEFDDSEEDSELILKFKEIEEGCELTLIHNNIPKGQPDYKKGWIENYLIPMKEFFSEK